MEVIQTISRLKKIDFTNDMIIIPILNNSTRHVSTTELSLLYIKDIKTKEEYMLSFTHYDTLTHLKLEGLRHLHNESVKYVYDKKEMLQIYAFDNLSDISLMQYLRLNKNINVEKYITKTHSLFYGKYKAYKTTNNLIPLAKHYEMCSALAKRFGSVIKKFEDSEEYRFYNDIAVPAFSGMERNGLRVDKEILEITFGPMVNKYISEGKVYTKYNFNTITGRPSNTFGGVNYAALKKADRSRESFISRFGDKGMLIEFDYVACHLYLIADIIGYEFPNELTGHEYMASQYFKTDTPTPEQVTKSKDITFQQMYGYVSREYGHIEFYKQLKEFINLIWIEHYKNKGVIPLIERKTPEVNNKQKLFNYFVQNYETKRNAPLIYDLNKLLENYDSKLVLYTYDSFLLDFNSDDGEELINKIKLILTEDNKFPISVKRGKNYKIIK